MGVLNAVMNSHTMGNMKNIMTSTMAVPRNH